MENVLCAGAIVYRINKEKREYLLIQSKHKKIWGFPKGHVETKESIYKTAIREVQEETGLRVNIINGFKKSIEYIVKRNKMKKVTFYIATTKDTRVNIQQKEIHAYTWCSYKKAREKITFQNSKELIDDAEKYLEKKMNTLTQTLKDCANKKRAKINSWFFKTGKGDYGEGDVFLGIQVPILRTISKDHTNLSLEQLEKNLSSRYHEERLVVLLILVNKYQQEKNEEEKKKIVTYYLEHTTYVNNWDLVDSTAHQILGDFLLNKNTTILDKLANSKNLWERRISIVSTFAFIRQKRFNETIKIATILLNDKCDLIHKAVGWMLREVGKKDEKTLIHYLDEHTFQMPRTMLRYAIERLPEEKRRYYLYKKQTF